MVDLWIRTICYLIRNGDEATGILPSLCVGGHHSAIHNECTSQCHSGASIGNVYVYVCERVSL